MLCRVNSHEAAGKVDRRKQPEGDNQQRMEVVSTERPGLRDVHRGRSVLAQKLHLQQDGRADGEAAQTWKRYPV